MSFPQVTRLRHAGTGFSGNPRHGYPIKAFGYDDGGDDPRLNRGLILSANVTRLKHSSASLSGGTFGHDKV